MEAEWYSPWYQGTGLFFWTGMALLPIFMVVSAPIIVVVGCVGVGCYLGVKSIVDYSNTHNTYEVIK
jgi:hypothetical protein